MHKTTRADLEAFLSQRFQLWHRTDATANHPEKCTETVRSCDHTDSTALATPRQDARGSAGEVRGETPADPVRWVMYTEFF